MEKQPELFEEKPKEWNPFDHMSKSEVDYALRKDILSPNINTQVPKSRQPPPPPPARHVQVILGNTPSKSNCYRIISFKSKDPLKHGHATLAKTSDLRSYEKSFVLQCMKYRNAGIKGKFMIEIDVYYPHDRSDLDNSLKVVLDCLQVVGAIENDKHCGRIVANKFLDKLNPRIEFTLTELIP